MTAPEDSAMPAGNLADLFAEAHELPPAERESLLERLRRERPDLAARLGELLDAAAAADSLLDQGVAGLAPEGGHTDEDDALPSHIGPYRLLREIGRGGMGRVFLAEQEEPDFRRTVALKVIDRSGIAGERIRRFREEVRILAALEHPGIARFLDGGRASDGTWFLALEYVEGTDLLTHCRTTGTTIHDRLTLFADVLDAVAHAHARGIVHRDLKPANILVGNDGRPRLLDFGISKLVVAPDASVTSTELRAFTPGYASPEQFRGERVSAASDVFSLGVMLYELLAGERPFGNPGTPPVELAAAVLAADPATPSVAARRRARRSTGPRRTGRGATNPATAGEESPAPEASPISGRLDRDLDAICLKALRREPAERFAGAAEFAADVRAYLVGRPVAARRGGWRYRATRFAARHRGGISAALVLAVATAIALVGARPFQLSRERHDPPPRAFPLSNPNPGAIETLEHAFLAQPADLQTGAELTLALGAAGRRAEAAMTLSRLRQIPGKEEDPLADYVDAVLAYQTGERQRALVLLATALDKAQVGARGDLVAQIRAMRGAVFAGLGRDAEARADMQLARRAFLQSRDWASLARVLGDLGLIERRAGHLSRAEALLTVGVRCDALAAIDGAPVRAPGDLHNLGSVATERGRPDIGAERLAEAVRFQRTAGDRMREARGLADLAVAHWYAGHGAEADAAIEQSILLKRKVASPSSLGFSLFFRAGFDAERGRFERVAAGEAELRALASKAGDRFGLALAEELAGRTAFARGRLDEGRQHFAESRRLALAASSAESASDTDILQSRLELEGGDLAEAERAAERAAEPYRAEGEKATVFTADALLARIAALAGRTAEAERRLAALEQADGFAPRERPMADQRILYLAARAELAAALGEIDAARRLYGEAIAACAASSRVVAGMALRLDAAALERQRGVAGDGRSTARAVEREATELGLTALATRARTVADLPPSPAPRRN